MAIKISDLSVGDWVRCGDENKQIKCIDYQNNNYFVYFSDPDTNDNDYAHIFDIDPIRITAEILEKNGLYRREIDEDNPQIAVLSDYFMMARTYDDIEWWRVLIYDEEIPSKELFNGIVYSVHQLQHAFRLAEVDKEINL